MVWDPTGYERFREPRARPFFDLLARIGDVDVRRAVDLGCGTGKLTRELLGRWPEAQVLGIDSSPEMLAGAEPVEGRLSFARDDIATWRPDAPFDLVLSNAALHWVADHEAVIPALAAAVAPGGALAVQVPYNFEEPSHLAIYEAVSAHPEPAVRPLAWYADTLTGLGLSVDAWETTYLHLLSGPQAVLDWVSGTTLRPWLAACADDGERERLKATVLAAYQRAYPRGPHGTWFPFKRRFFVARRPSA